MRNRVCEKLKSRKGFTIGEMLISVLILLMVTAIIAAGIPAASNAYFKVVDSANAQMLLSTTLTRLRAELGTATEVRCDGTVIIYRCAGGSWSKIWIVPPPANPSAPDAKAPGIWLQEYYDPETDSGEAEYAHLLVSLKAAGSLYMTYSVESSKNAAGKVTLLTFKDLTVRKGSQKPAAMKEFKVRMLAEGLPTPSPAPAATP